MRMESRAICNRGITPEQGYLQSWHHPRAGLSAIVASPLSKPCVRGIKKPQAQLCPTMTLATTSDFCRATLNRRVGGAQLASDERGPAAAEGETARPANVEISDVVQARAAEKAIAHGARLD